MGRIYGDFTTCKYCGERIFFIKMQSGKHMPVDANGKFYDLKGHGDRLVLDEGRIISCRITEKPDEKRRYGYIPHFNTCSNREEMKRKPRRKKDA